MKPVLACLFLALTCLAAAQIEGDRIAESRKQRAQQVEAFRAFTGVSLNGQYDWKLQQLIGETVKPYGVKWAQPSRTVPVIWLTFETQEDRLLPKGRVIATFRAQLRTELQTDRLGQLQIIRHPWGVDLLTFIAESKEAAQLRAETEVVRLMRDFGELWKASHRPPQ